MRQAFVKTDDAAYSLLDCSMLIQKAVAMEESVMLLEMKQVTKKIFSSVLLDHVDFSMEKGEIHALIGPNGAGRCV